MVVVLGGGVILASRKTGPGHGGGGHFGRRKHLEMWTWLVQKTSKLGQQQYSSSDFLHSGYLPGHGEDMPWLWSMGGRVILAGRKTGPGQGGESFWRKMNHGQSDMVLIRTVSHCECSGLVRGLAGLLLGSK